MDNLRKVLQVIGKRNLWLLLISLVVTLVSVFFNDNWLLAAREESEELSKLNKSALEIAKLKTNLLAAESAQRGYLLTNSSDYLSPYNDAIIAAKKNISDIRNFFHSIDAIKAYEKENNLLIKISNSIASKVSEMDLTLKFAKDGNIAEAKKVVNLDNGLIEMKKFGAYSDTLINLLNKRILESHKSREFKRVIARSSTILSPLILLSLVILVVKQLIDELSKKAKLQVTLAEEIHNHRQAIEDKSQLLRSLSLEYQSDVEREKYKLAREIHDELGSILTATKMDVSWVIKSLKNSHSEIAEKLTKTKKYIDQGINFKRQIVQDLHPSTITSFGFWPALTNLIEDMAERGNWELELTLPKEDVQLNETIGLITYRIIQETLNNAIKYAKADKVSVHVIHDEQQLKIEIQDNGIGLDLNSLTDETHGINGMRNRVNALGGFIELSSHNDSGLLTLVILPL